MNVAAGNTEKRIATRIASPYLYQELPPATVSHSASVGYRATTGITPTYTYDLKGDLGMEGCGRGRLYKHRQRETKDDRYAADRYLELFP